MDLFIWLGFVALALFFDLLMGRSKRQRKRTEREERDRLRAWEESAEPSEPYVVQFPYPGSEERVVETRSLEPETRTPRRLVDSEEQASLERTHRERVRPVETPLDEIAEWEARRTRREERKPAGKKRSTERTKRQKTDQNVARHGGEPIPQQASHRMPAHAPTLRSGRERLILTPGTARHAVVLMEVLGRPKGLE